MSLQTPGIPHSSFREPSPGSISLFLNHFIGVCSQLSENEEVKNFLEGLKNTLFLFLQRTLNKECPLKINKNAKYFGEGISGTQV